MTQCRPLLCFMHKEHSGLCFKKKKNFNSSIYASHQVYLQGALHKASSCGNMIECFKEITKVGLYVTIRHLQGEVRATVISHSSRVF